MYLQDQNHHILNIANLRNEILAEIDTVAVPTEQEAKEALTELHRKAQATVADYFYKGNAGQYQLDLNMESFIGNWWEQFKKFLCKFLSATSSVEEIIEKILEFVAQYIPGGVFIKYLVMKLIKYVLNWGYEALCPVGEAA